MMKQLVENFPQQIEESISIAEQAFKNIHIKEFSQIVISGLGGSGIGGTILNDMVRNISKVPIIINKTYQIPSCVNNNTLFVACSYSGNTEETINALQHAIKKNAQVICITSGGKISEIVNKKKLPCILIPAGMPPRACLGYSLVQLLFLVKKCGIISWNIKSSLLKGIENITVHNTKIINQAKKISDAIHNKITAIYCTDRYEGMAVRLRQQLNENSKVLAWHHVIPEMTHNEIVGWTENHENIAVVFLYADTDLEKNIRRTHFLKQVVKKYKSSIVEIKLSGKDEIIKLIEYIHLTDWVSIFLAQKRNCDPTEVRIIDKLKKYMAE